MAEKFKGRREDRRLVTGQGKYTSDWNFPNQVYGQFLRSDRAHAEIESIDTSDAIASPGVLAVLIGKDAVEAGVANPPNLVRYPGKDGMQLRVPFRDVLANTHVRYVGQEIALVVAETTAQAQDAVEKIVINFRDLPAVVTPQDAMAPDAPLIHAEIPGNISFDYVYGDEAKTAKAFAPAAHVVRVTLDAQRLVGNPMEPKCCVATYDAGTGVYDIYCPTQGLTMMQDAFAGTLAVAPEKLRIHAHDVGGGFGVRADAYGEFVALSLAAKKLGRPVKWIGTRSETIVSDHHGRAAELSGELALDKKGKFLGLRVNWLVNMGAYCTSAGPFINTAAPSGQSAGLYNIPAVAGFHRLVFTNTTPTTAYRGAGRPNASYLMERLVDVAARVTGIDRVELRRRNLIAKESFPYKTQIGAVYDSGDPRGLLDEVVRAADYAGFKARRAEAKRRGRLRGVGIALFIEPSGGGVKDEVAIKFGASGNADLFAMVGPSGQGNETVYPEIVGEIFGIAPEKLTLRYSDPDGPALVGMGSIGSRSLMNHGGALMLAAREVIKKGLELAARDLEVAASDLVFEAGRYHVPGTDLSVELVELARRHASATEEHPLDVKTEMTSVMAWPSGAHIAEVEVDPETGTVAVARYVAVDDCGRVINHTIVEGQLHGGIVQGIGQVMGEHCMYDRDNGQLQTGTFMDYFMPRAALVPSFELHDHPTLSPTNPLGAKGAGEAGTTGAVPTLASAVIDALSPVGVTHLDTPYSPSRVWHAIQAARQAG